MIAEDKYIIKNLFTDINFVCSTSEKPPEYCGKPVTVYKKEGVVSAEHISFQKKQHLGTQQFCFPQYAMRLKARIA